MARLSAQARRHLDQRLADLRHLLDAPRPPRGWVRAIRDALGMSGTELARRMGVSQSTVANLERSEAAGSIKLHSLQRIAEALNCEVVYFLVPRKSLEETVRERARHKATQHLGPVEHHSRLENQTVSSTDLEAQLDELTDRFVELRGLWADEEE